MIIQKVDNNRSRRHVVKVYYVVVAPTSSSMTCYKYFFVVQIAAPEIGLMIFFFKYFCNHIIQIKSDKST